MLFESDRRAFIASGSAALLSGCATVGTRTASDCTPLPPVDADASRLIRAEAGLRPYRRSGFVVRAEALGDKKLVHNYGHGGSGITLSWGTSKLATELGLPGHSGAVAVIGGGIMGLSTARLVQDAGFPVTIYAAALPPETTSNIAGGQFHPAYGFAESAVTPSSWPSSPARSTTAGGDSRSWSAINTAFAGFPPMWRPTARKRSCWRPFRQ